MSLIGVLSEAGAGLEILKTMNAGADVGQFLNQLSRTLERTTRYDFVLKMHSKTDATWRQRSIATLCGSTEQVHSLYAAFEGNPSLGVVAPQGTVFHANTPITGLWDHLRHRYFEGKHTVADAFDVWPLDGRLRCVDVRRELSMYGSIVALTTLT